MRLRERINQLEVRIVSRLRRLFIVDAADTPDVEAEVQRLRAAHKGPSRFLIIEDDVPEPPPPDIV